MCVMPDENASTQFSASEVNLLIYHYLKESGFLHTCFTLRYEARLDDVTAAHQPIVQPGQLLHFLHRGLLYTEAERHVQKLRSITEASPSGANDNPSPSASLPKPEALVAPTCLTPSIEVQPEKVEKYVNASSQTSALPCQPSAMSPPIEQPGSASTPSISVGSTSAKRRLDWDVHASDKRSRNEAVAMDVSPPSGELQSEGSARRSKSKAKNDHARRSSSNEQPLPTTSSSRSPKITPSQPASIDPDAIVLSGHTAEVFVSAWNPTVPDLLASGAGDGTVRIWDMASPHDPPVVCKHLPPTQAKNVSSVAWNPDGTLLASGSYDGILRLWTPQGDLHLVMSMHQGPIFSVRWNRKGNLLLTGSADGSAIVWDVSSGRTRQQFSLHADNVLDVQWLTGRTDEKVAHPNQALADSLFATCSADNTVHVCKLGEPKPIKTYSRHKDEVNAIRFDPSQTLLASASDDGSVHIWALCVSGLAMATSVVQNDADPLHVLRGHTQEVYALAWNSTGPGSSHVDQPRMLATASFDHTARIWHGDTGACLRIIDGHEMSVYAICFSPCARYLATGGIDHRVLITRILVRKWVNYDACDRYLWLHLLTHSRMHTANTHIWEMAP